MTAVQQRYQSIIDADLSRRVHDTVERAIATAKPKMLDVDTDDGVEITSVWWTWRTDGDTSAQRTTHPEFVDYVITVDTADDPDAGPWLFAATRPDFVDRVNWMPGMGFNTPAEFLNWFEAGAGVTR